MEKKSQNFSMEEVMQLAKSPAGQQLLALLQQKDSAALQQAAVQASRGDYQQAGKTLQTLLSDPKARELMEQLGGRHG